MEITTTVEFEVFCAECGAGLCGDTETRKSHGRGFDQIAVAPCSKCIDNAVDRGIDKGWDAAMREVERNA